MSAIDQKPTRLVELAAPFEQAAFLPPLLGQRGPPESFSRDVGANQARYTGEGLNYLD